MRRHSETQIPYSTGRTEPFAPLKRKARRMSKCKSRAGRRRLDHQFDRDGICIFCDQAAP